MGKHITVTGLPSYQQHTYVPLPSGSLNIPVEAELLSINATFGFNQQPHQISLEFVPIDFSASTLPSVGSGVSFTLGENFYVRGTITQVDYNKTAGGKVLTIVIRDDREDLNNVYIDTEGIFGKYDTPKDGVVDMRHWALNAWDYSARQYGLNKHKAERELKIMAEHGTTYRNLYDAIEYYESLGTISNISTKIPAPEVIEAQLDEDPQGYRWTFSNEPLLRAMATILGDVSYDFYWSMRDEKIHVVNRKYAINISESDIPSSEDESDILASRYGDQEAEKASKVQVYGAQMEAMLGYQNTFGSLSNYDLGFTPVSSFSPAWPLMKVSYWWGGAFLRSYTPSDEELKMALLGIEQWANYKGLANRI